MANIPRYIDRELNNTRKKVVFDLKSWFGLPTIQLLIYFHVNFHKCSKTIISKHWNFYSDHSKIAYVFYLLMF